MKNKSWITQIDLEGKKYMEEFRKRTKLAGERIINTQLEKKLVSIINPKLNKQLKNGH